MSYWQIIKPYFGRVSSLIYGSVGPLHYHELDALTMSVYFILIPNRNIVQFLPYSFLCELRRGEIQIGDVRPTMHQLMTRACRAELNGLTSRIIMILELHQVEIIRV